MPDIPQKTISVKRTLATEPAERKTQQESEQESLIQQFIHDTNFTERYVRENIHKFYLILALFFGLIMSIGLPMFNEPDGTYHFEDSAAIVRLTTDLSQVGYPTVASGTYQQIPFYQKGIYFKTFFEQPAHIISISQVPRALDYHTVSYDFFGHLVSAIGMWVGYHIYPSIGMMTVFGRLLSVLIYSLIIYFVIRHLRRGKLLFTAIMLSPVVLSQFASFSYDGLSTVLVAVTVAFIINTLEKNRTTWRTLLGMLGLSIALIFGAKTNFVLLVAFFPVILITRLLLRRKEESEKNNPALSHSHMKKRWDIWLWGWLAFLAFLVGCVWLAIKVAAPYGGLGDAIYRFFISTFYASSNNLTNSTFMNADITRAGNIPVWLSVVWFILLIICVLSDTKYVRSSFASFFALVLILLNMIGVGFSFFGSIYSGSYSYSNTFLGGIFGIQGRYFTPFWLLLTVFFGNAKFKMRLTSYRTVVLLMMAIVSLSSTVYIFDTLFTLIYTR